MLRSLPQVKLKYQIEVCGFVYCVTIKYHVLKLAVETDSHKVRLACDVECLVLSCHWIRELNLPLLFYLQFKLIERGFKEVLMVFCG